MILYVNACLRNGSRTQVLAKHALSHYSADEICELDLQAVNPLPLNTQRLEKRDALLHQGNYDDACFDLAKQFAQADEIIIAAPFWEMSFPALLKIYIENIAANGITFYYDDNGIPHGKCHAKRLLYITTAGGRFVPGFGYGNIEMLAKLMFGIPTVELVYAQCLDIYGTDVDAELQKAKKYIDNLYRKGE